MQKLKVCRKFIPFFLVGKDMLNKIQERSTIRNFKYNFQALKKNHHIWDIQKFVLNTGVNIHTIENSYYFFRQIQIKTLTLVKWVCDRDNKEKLSIE